MASRFEPRMEMNEASESVALVANTPGTLRSMSVMLDTLR